MASQDAQNATREGEANESVTAEEALNRWKQAEAAIAHMKGDWGNQKDQITRENQELKERLAGLEGRVDEQRTLFGSANQKAEADPFELDEATADAYRNDPTQMLGFVKERLRAQEESYLNAVVGLLHDREANVTQRFNAIDGTLQTVKRVVDPEIAPWREQIDELRTKGEVFKKLDDKSLIEIAKTMGLKPMEYRGDAGSGRHGVGEGKQTAREFDPHSMAGQLIMRLADGDKKRAESIWKRQEARRMGA